MHGGVQDLAAGSRQPRLTLGACGAGGMAGRKAPLKCSGMSCSEHHVPSEPSQFLFLTFKWVTMLTLQDSLIKMLLFLLVLNLRLLFSFALGPEEHYGYR